MSKRFPNFRQHDEMDCGPSCLRIISKHYGKDFSLNFLRSLSFNTRAGSNLMGLSEAAQKIGFKTMGAKVTYDNLVSSNPTPFICYWNQNHFIVVYKITKKKVWVSDPGHGHISYSRDEFLKGWSADSEKGIVLLLETTSEFEAQEQGLKEKKNNFRYVLFYFKKYKKIIFQLLLGLLSASIIQSIFPFLTQALVDTGIRQNDLDFIYLILFAQLFLFLGRVVIEIIRGYLLLHLSSRINISLLSDFFIKLMHLPLGFFDTKMTGDILQRINDHQRVESFLTSGILSATFSFINLLVFGTVLLIYDIRIFAVFLVGGIVYFLWIRIFAKKRADLDYKRFSQLSQTSEKNVEMIYGMQEIKLNNAQNVKQWEWEHMQVKLFRINFQGLSLKQVQEDGASIINELKNIIITFLAAKLVVEHHISLGVMLSISFIIGQLNGPILQLTQFMQNYQDATLSLERINEIHQMDNEEVPGDDTVTDVDVDRGIYLNNVSFKYAGMTNAPWILKDISITLPPKKVTAIVGSSGSGKTTLLKLLMKFYEPGEGTISVGDNNLAEIPHSAWRDRCGVVMQEGFLFNDSIAKNIALGSMDIDKERLVKAASLANIMEYIMLQPMRFNTRLGYNGVGVSTGQKQRMLIARAIYKNPDILFFDEATSALDAANERVIVENLSEFFQGKTVCVIAHRLSTVKNADQIIVLEKGEIAETGTHESLVKAKGIYYNLVKNQIELGT
jgi:ATP-binding cassette, subfamily B, bacterial